MPALHTEKGLTAASFFVVRTPLLPFDEILGLAEGLEVPRQAKGLTGEQLDRVLRKDRRLLQGRLEAAFARPEVLEALWIASPGLYDSLALFLKEPDSRKGRRVEGALFRYFVRMATRPTPFGLFAGCSVGIVAADTHLSILGRDAYLRHTRLDMEYLSSLSDAVVGDNVCRQGLTFRPNSSLLRANDRLHYVEGRLEAGVRVYDLVGIDLTPHLVSVLAQAETGATAAMLATMLVEVDSELSIVEAEKYVGELISNQVLVADLSPAVTGTEPLVDIVDQLQTQPATSDFARRLAAVDARLKELDTRGLGVRVEDYKAIGEILEPLPGKLDFARFVQVDLLKPGDQLTLGSMVINEALRAVSILHKLAPSGLALDDGLKEFRRSFEERYGSEEVPLLEALDEEKGVGFDLGAATWEPPKALAGLTFPPSSRERTFPWGMNESLALRKLTEALSLGSGEVTLEERDFEFPEDPGTKALPDALAVLATLSSESPDSLSRGEFRLLVKGVSGPSGARLLGRFCHGNPELAEYVRVHLRQEESLRPNEILAEVVHIPEGRYGNFLCRPILRRYEITYLGRSGAPPANQIPASDLLLSSRTGHLILRSERLGLQITPRLTAAHNYGTARALPVYRFLCALQDQGTCAHLSWNWGPLYGSIFLPRVVCGRLVLERARWMITREELDLIRKSGRGAALFDAVQGIRGRRGLPRYLLIPQGDNEMLVDLDNQLALEMLSYLVKHRDHPLSVVEMWPSMNQLSVSGPEGRFAHELVIPLSRTETGRPSQSAASDARRNTAARRFTPGSRWLYAKLYTGERTADAILCKVIHPLVRELTDLGIADRWFFVRYRDPRFHLRLRIHVESRTGWLEAFRALRRRVEPLMSARVLAKLQFDTYDREVERYGGTAGTNVAEQLFCRDSDAALAIIGLCLSGGGGDLRFRLAVCGVDMLLSDFGFDTKRKLSLIEAQLEALARQWVDADQLRREIARRYWQNRPWLEPLLRQGQIDDANASEGVRILRSRSEWIKPLAQELRHLEEAGELSAPLGDLATSCVHMQINRILRCAQREDEAVMYTFLRLFYESLLARIRCNGAKAVHEGKVAGMSHQSDGT